MTHRVGLFSTDFARKGPFAADAVNWGGVGEVVYQLATRLVDRGHEVVVFTSSQMATGLTTTDGLTVRDFGTQLPVGNKHVSLSMLFGHLRESVDVVHAHRGLPSGVLAGAAHATTKGVPLVVTVHGDLHYTQDTPIRNRLLGVFDRVSPRLLATADAVTTVSESFRRQSGYLEPVRDDAVVIANGTAPGREVGPAAVGAARERLDLGDSEHLILYLGALEPRKNPTTLLEAAPAVLESHPGAQFVFAGGGDRLREFRSQVAEMGLGDRVDFRGFVPEDLKADYFRAADLYCLPSEDESSGLAPLEAATHGLPLVLGDIPVFDELFGGAARFVDPGDPDEVASVVGELLASEEERQRMRDRSLEVANRYSWSRMVDEYESLYDDVLSN